MVAVKPRPTVEVELGGQRHTVSPLQIRVLRLLELFESKSAMADFFGVQRSQPGQWARGATPAGTTAAQLTDLSFVWDRATEDQPDEAVRVWLTSPNRFLGERPLDAVSGGRVAEVITAWDAYMEGSFA
jgi:hypothetical protein